MKRIIAKAMGSAVLALSLAACGGGGGGGGGGGAPPVAANQSDFQRGIFTASSNYKDLCQNPRSASADIQGTTEDENDWLRAWSNDLYLWYDEIADADPALHTTPAYFDLMRTFETTPSGADKDQFHFTYDTEVWQQLSQAGISAGYGADVVLISTTPPRRAVIASVQAGSPADMAGITRGTAIVTVDGADLVNGNDVDALNAGLFPDAAGETHSFGVENFDGSNPRTVDITSAELTQNTVPLAQVLNTAAGPVGYMVFDAFLAPSEERLIDEINNFAAAGINELVLDLRYNGGGFLDIANELAYMIAGTSAQGFIFEEMLFNDKHPTINPVTGATLSPDAFLTTSQGFSVAPGNALPTLNLSRVFILTGARTGSASESVINGLRGINFPVILIGEPTTGKPYGFYATDNCGTTYFSIQFQGVNAQGYGDFADGFVPTETPVEEFEVQGCDVADDFSRELGDPDEWRLATALGYIVSSDCSAAPVATARREILPLRTEQGPNPAALSQPRQLPGGVRTR